MSWMKIKAIILIMIPQISLSEELYDYKILNVIDGDTVKIEAPFLPNPLKKEISLRIIGVDTPEKSFRAHCSIESNLSDKATEFTKQAISKAKVKKIIIISEDKYFRLLGDIKLDGKYLSKMLIQNGFAYLYDGGKKKSWCE